MMNLLYLVASAIATAEGYFSSDPNALPKKNFNPGDLRAAPWLGPRKQDSHGFTIFNSPSEGIAGLYHQIALDIARGKTLCQLIEKWAPPSENDTSTYIEETVRRTSLNPDIPLMQYLEIDRIP